MKNKIFYLSLLLTLLAACSPAPAVPISAAVQMTDIADPTQPPTTSASEAAQPPATDVRLPTATLTPKPPLEKDAWKEIPAVPTEISEAMRLVYERGLALGNDPNHFSIIGDCQNVSS